MATRDTPFAAGTPCWVDLLTTDVEKSAAFYTGLFGWEAETSGDDFGNYVIYTLGGQPVAGQTPNQSEFGSADGWTTYIATDDCAATVDAAEAAGAQVVAPTMPVGDSATNVGTMAVLVDPAGALFGLWQAGQHTGFGRYNEAGCVTWDEHHSKSFAASKSFYADVFGWDFDVESDTDDFRYVTAKVGGETVAGLMDSASFLPENVPSHWAVYFSVASVDDAVAKLQELGGSLLRPAEDTPFGRIADAADATGAPFKLHQAPSEQQS